MAYIHPVIMACAILVAFYALRLGLARFAAVRMGRKTVFPWKRHVGAGKLAVVLILAGMCGGFGVTWLIWRGPLTTEAHWKVAACMLPLALFAVWSGRVLDARKRSGTPLGLAHALNNMLLCLLAALQVATGIDVLVDFVW